MIVKKIVRAESEIRTIVNNYKGKRDLLEREETIDNYSSETVFKKLVRQHININKIQFSLMLGCETKDAIFIFSDKKNLPLKTRFT